MEPTEVVISKLVAKLRAVEAEISKQRGSFTLFALFLREEAPNRWDLVASAPWFGASEKKTLDYLVKKLKTRLGESEMLLLSRIVLVDESNPSLDPIHRTVQVEHGEFEVNDSVYSGLQIKHAFFITSKRQSPVTAGRAS